MKLFSLKSLLSRHEEDDSSSQKSREDSEHMIREIKGSIFTLLALFELIALTSYIPMDSFNLFSGRIDHINNLGGIVGAIVSEGFLGTVGILGYSIIVLTVWLAIQSFRGRQARESWNQAAGTVLGSLLGAISCQLLFFDTHPEASLLQGGVIGKYLGTGLQRYFNTTGALLIVGFGFIVTFILTTGL